MKLKTLPGMAEYKLLRFSSFTEPTKGEKKIIEYLLNSDTFNYLGFFGIQIQVSGLKKII